MAKINLDINGSKQVVDVDPNTPVLWVLRDHLNLVGTKYGCGIAHSRGMQFVLVYYLCLR
jgi:aerobic-type carbon monoxide dehydrogenase small subunit (CoxS/CutS family)